MTRSLLLIARLALAGVFLTIVGTAQAEVASAQTEDAYRAQTYDAENPSVEIARLELLLKPLTRKELEAELVAWRDALAARSTAVSSKRIELMDASEDARSTLLDEVNRLVEARSAVADRLLTVVNAAEAKGVDIKEFREYVAAATGLEVDVFDPAAAWSAILGWLTSAEGGIQLGLNIIQFFLTLIVFAFASRLAAGIVSRAMSKVRNASALLRDFAVNSTRKLVFFIGIVAALSMIGINIGPFIAAIGAAGFIIGFALQGTLSNFAAGIMILIYRPYDVGEVVTVAGETGKVDEMSLVATTLRKFDNQIVVIPNSSIWGDVITNTTGVQTRRVDMKFGCAYSDDLAKAEQLFRDIIEAHPKVLAEPAPTIRVHELADSSVNFIVRPWSNTADYWDVFWDVTRSVKDRFDSEGLNIPFPQRDVHLHK